MLNTKLSQFARAQNLPSKNASDKNGDVTRRLNNAHHSTEDN